MSKQGSFYLSFLFLSNPTTRFFFSILDFEIYRILILLKHFGVVHGRGCITAQSGYGSLRCEVETFFCFVSREYIFVVINVKL